MPFVRRPWSSLALLTLALAGCDGEGKTNAPGDRGSASKSGPAASCAKGDRSVGEGIVNEARAARLTDPPGDYAAARAFVREACEAGCGVACLEYARNSWDEAEADDYNQRACDAGEDDGCARLSNADAGSWSARCEAGDPLACSGGDPSVVVERSADACAANEGRACAVHGWTRCAFLGECDGEALDALDKAARLVPAPPVLEARAALQCHSGDSGSANAVLAGLCDGGHDDACDRSCEQLLPDRSVLVRAAERAAFEEIVTLAELQANVSAGWYPTISVMNLAELQKTQKVLQVFTPGLTEAGSKAKVPDDIRAKYPVLVAALLRAPQLDGKKIKYWLERLPKMEDEQRVNLMDSLRNQWWVLPQEGSRAPVDVIDDARWTNGGFGSLPPAE